MVDFDQEEEPVWHEKCLQAIRAMPPAAFERLIQRLLRESGFKNVEVTGRTGDGGIDGFGLASVNGFLSFRVLFQCKRYQGSVSPSEIRDFRGAMQGRTEKGLYVTTGTFTREAVKEATRDGAPPIDLLNGEQLVQCLKNLGLGVKVSMVEVVEVDEDWISQI
jgi:restriction system protein